MTNDDRCQHGWVTPPECPQCCAEERDRLEAELESHAWEVSPAMVQAKLDELNREIERLKADNRALESELARVFDALGISNLPDAKPLPTHEHVARLKAENARLENELAMALSSPMTQAALRDLLAPTIKAIEAAKELIDQCATYTRRANVAAVRYTFAEASDLVDKELTRLRAACGEGK